MLLPRYKCALTATGYQIHQQITVYKKWTYFPYKSDHTGSITTTRWVQYATHRGLDLNTDLQYPTGKQHRQIFTL